MENFEEVTQKQILKAAAGIVLYFISINPSEVNQCSLSNCQGSIVESRERLKTNDDFIPEPVSMKLAFVRRLSNIRTNLRYFSYESDWVASDVCNGTGIGNSHPNS